jgi:hypothetical protein
VIKVESFVCPHAGLAAASHAPRHQEWFKVYLPKVNQ